ncbi:hypothetical protein FA95DRAFT_1463808, partial [Auriscalpium vulgare]
VRSNVTDDLLGSLPCFEGMRVMITENLSMGHGVVNGSEGTVVKISYREGEDGERSATCAYVHIPDCGMNMVGLPQDVVPIFPVKTIFEFEGHRIRRQQLPVLPAYAYTDYKSQGRSLDKVIVDLA